MIPIKPQTIWIVNKGWVKLSTLSEKGEEVAIGFPGEQMPFGPSLTALPIYQAIALSDRVELTYLSLEDVSRSPRLREFLLSGLHQRLRQMELLLAV